MDTNAQYVYAYDDSGDLVNVNALEKSSARNHKYTCIGCGKMLVPVLGKIRIKHFRHGLNENCSPETYLHKLGKQYFFQLYTQCLDERQAFTITFETSKICNYYHSSVKQSCKLESEVETYDLTSYFPEIRMEQRDGEFIPDLLLSNARDDKMYIEIAVTHESTRKKRNSGLRIIEIHLSDEIDLEVLDTCNISFRDSRVRFYNFQTQRTKDYCESNCGVDYEVFLIRKSCKSILTNMNLKQLFRTQQQEDIIYSRIVGRSYSNYDFDKGLTFVREVIKAYRSGKLIKNCFLCRYHGTSESQTVYCKFLSKHCSSNEAASCQYYRADPSVFPDVF